MTVIIPKKAYLTILAATVRFANTRIQMEDWLEVYGIFIGKNEGDDVMITEAYPITHQVKKKEDIIDKVYWSDVDYESFSIIDDDAFGRGEFAVGWWHSHPGFKVMLSGFGDKRTTLAYQENNPLAFALVFNPLRLIRQVELPDKKGDPIKQLKGDPGFKIFRLDDVRQGDKGTYHEADYKILGYDDMEQLVKSAQKFIIDVTNFFPKDNIFQIYETFIKDQINQLNSLLIGTEEYLMTLTRKGETNRVPEVLENQNKEIRKFVANTFIKIESIKEFMDYLEYKERESIIPKAKDILSEWDLAVSNLNDKLAALLKKF